MSDDLSGDMLAPSWPNLVEFMQLRYYCVYDMSGEVCNMQLCGVVLLFFVVSFI